MLKKLSISVGVVALAVCFIQPAWGQTSGATRPHGYSTGVGAGWTFPGTEVLTPNTVSVRFRLPNGLTFEPIVAVNYGQTTSGITGVEDDVVKDFTLGAGALVRVPLAGRKKVDLQLLAGGGFALTTSTDDMAGPNNAVDTTVIGFGAVWGLAVEYFISDQWSWTFDAINPFLTYETTKVSPPGGIDSTTSEIQVGAIFAPTIRLMTHIYF